MQFRQLSKSRPTRSFLHRRLHQRQAAFHDELMRIHVWPPVGCSDSTRASQPSIRKELAVVGSAIAAYADGSADAKGSPIFARAGAVTMQLHPIRNDLRPGICYFPSLRPVH